MSDRKRSSRQGRSGTTGKVSKFQYRWRRPWLLLLYAALASPGLPKTVSE